MKKITILIPCYNEASTIGKVIDDFRNELPNADIVVYDNNSTDGTDAVALEHGAKVKYERLQGKANVVRSMFRDIESDYYIMVDGDDTYPAGQIGIMLKELEGYEYDMIIGDRLTNGTYAQENKRHFHQFGNNLVKQMINIIFKSQLHDIMSGYRIFSRRFAKIYPVLCERFEIETEMTIFALNNNLSIKEVPIDFKDRPEGSVSKLNTISDGYKVILKILNLFRHYKPLLFFGIITLLFIILSLIFGIPVIVEYFKYQYIYKVPSAILASGLMLFAVLSFSVGLILDTISQNDRKYYSTMITNYSCSF